MRLGNLLSYGLLAGHTVTVAFSFRTNKVEKQNILTGPRRDPNLNLSELLKSGSRPSDIYTTALSELQALESKPLCHRVAARLLVGNCQLIDGKDEATIFTDSGRKIRDFVDAYAASMAICDLERGNIRVPATCEKFREPTLAQLPFDDQAQLHVTTREIDLCISGLGETSSTWSTWISYREKTLRFCEAARADQEKAQNILLYQRLTKVMAKLTYGVEVEMQRHMDNLELRVKKAGDAVQGLEPDLDRLQLKLAKLTAHFNNDLQHTVQRSGDSITKGQKGAENLQHLLAVMIQTVLDGTSQVAAAQVKSVELADQGKNDINSWVAVMEAAASSAHNLNSRIEQSHLEVQAIAQQQDALSTNLDRLVTTTDSLYSKFEEQAYALDEARNMTNEILETLDGVVRSAVVIVENNRPRWGAFELGILMPYIVSPAATLLLGSYGLAPSALRNLGLVALGEVVGFAVSHLHCITFAPMAMSSYNPTKETSYNTTVVV